jgi:hypothetical protein
MSKCEICGSIKEVTPIDVKPVIRAARRKHDLCELCKDKINQGDAEIILALGGIIGQELLRKVSQPPTK